MSNLKHIKIKLDGLTTLEVAAKALVDVGYEDVRKDKNYLNANALYAYSGGLVLKSSDEANGNDYFSGHRNEEYFVAAGKLVSKDYWTQPVTITIHGPESEQFKKAQKDFADKTTYEPLPFHLKPRSEFLHERNVDIINVMLEYVTEGKRIPDDMISELTTNNAEIYK